MPTHLKGDETKMSNLFAKLKATSSKTFKLGKVGMLLDATATIVERTFTLPNANVDLSGGTVGQVLKKTSATAIGWANESGGGGGQIYYRSFSNNNISNQPASEICPPMLMLETSTISLAKLALKTPVGQDVTFDLKKNGISILNTLVTILSGNQISANLDFSSTAIAANDILTLEITSGSCDAFSLPIKFQI